MGEYVESMVEGFVPAMKDRDVKKIVQLTKTEELIDQLYEDIKLYVAKIARQEVDEPESHRIAEIMSFTTNLENIGDIAENMLELTSTMAKNQLCFSDEGAADLLELHKSIASNLTLSMAVFMSGDIEVARQLVSAKREINELERTLVERHLERLREGRPESIETSTIHMDMLHNLRRIHSHITAVAYPILEAAGELRKSRLKKRG